MSGQTLTALVHGEAGTGKSWLCASSPPPRLVLDAEGRAKYLPSEHPIVYWDPRHQSPPEPGAWDTCVAVVPDFATMDLVYRWLQSGQHPFVSVCVDSLMEIQKRLIDQISPLEQLERGDWGDLLRQLEKLVRDYRDLTISESNPIQCVVFTVGSREVNGKMKPMLQGAMRDQVPYFVDIVGYLYVTHTPEGGVTRSMLVSPSQMAVAKDGTDRLTSTYGPTVQDPDLAEIFARLNGQPAAPPPLPPVGSQSQATGGVPQ